MRTIDEQIELLESLLNIARQRKEAGETEWLEFKTNISESHSSITYERVGEYISGISNSACLKDKPYGYLILGIEDATWDLKGTNLRMPEQKMGNQDYELWLRKNLSPKVTFDIQEFDYNGNHRPEHCAVGLSTQGSCYENYFKINRNGCSIIDCKYGCYGS